jgi:hypothetical protein
VAYPYRQIRVAPGTLRRIDGALDSRNGFGDLCDFGKNLLRVPFFKLIILTVKDVTIIIGQVKEIFSEYLEKSQ